jgi:hypothetical protein
MHRVGDPFAEANGPEAGVETCGASKMAKRIFVEIVSH